MLGDDARRFLIGIHNLDEIWRFCDGAEYNERQLVQFAERYHEWKLNQNGSISTCEKCKTRYTEEEKQVGHCFNCGEQ